MRLAWFYVHAIAASVLAAMFVSEPNPVTAGMTVFGVLGALFAIAETPS